MSDITAALLDLNIFKNYTATKNLAIAVNERGQIVVALANVVKTTIASEKRNYYKILSNRIDDFEVEDLLFNHSGNMLALIGHHNVVMLDTKSLPVFDGKSVNWNAFNFPIGPFTNTVKCVQWLPSSVLGTELVVLTSRELFLFNVVVSMTQPMVTLQLLDYPQLNDKSVESITFGSMENFSGSLTLYLTTSCGLVYAISPFLHKDSKIKTTKRLAWEFVEECKEAVEIMDISLPPVALLNYPQVTALNQQLIFAEGIEKQLSSPYIRSLEDNDSVILKHTAERFGFKLLGPIARSGPGAKVIQTASNGIVSVLACVHSENNKAVFSYFAQLQPLIMGWDNLQPPSQPPAKPQILPRKEVLYSKPAKGFGYIVDSDEEDDEEAADFESRMTQYKADLEHFELAQVVGQYFEENFNKLTQFGWDETSLNYSGEGAYFSDVEGSSFIWAHAGQLVYAVYKDVVKYLFADGDFDVEYKTKSVAPSATVFASYKDTIGGLGLYALVDAAKVEVIHLDEPKKKTVALLKPSQPVPDESSEKVDTGVLTEELSALLLSVPKTLPPLTDFDPGSTKSLLQVLSVTNLIADHTGAYTKFMLALQLKIQTQLEVLSVQIDELNEVNNQAGLKSQINQEMIEQLTMRQERILARMKSVEKSVLKRFLKIKLSHNLPLSSAEKEWFKEINQITKLVQVDEGDNLSLVTQLDKLTSEVQVLSKGLTNMSKSDINAAIEQHAVGNELAVLQRFLEIEGKGISRIEQRIGLCQRTLEAYDG